MKAAMILCVPVLVVLVILVFGCRSTASVDRAVASEQRVLQIYEARLEQWPVSYESLQVATSFGNTHVIACGDAANPPVVLIHAFGAGATMWAANVEDLARDHRVYAIDVIGDLGQSALDDPKVYPRDGRAYSSWLTEVFDGLGIEAANVVGSSMGGWITLNLAIHAPERVDRIALLGPMGIPPVTLKVMIRLLSLALFPTEGKKERLIDWAIGDHPAAVETYGEYLRAAMDCASRVRVAPPKKLSEKELARINAPTLLILGGKDGPIGDPDRSARRAKRTIPNVTVEILPDSGHMMSTEAPEVVNARLVEFFGEDMPPAGRGGRS
ncbi:MAG: alpha/beta fold hydrolase [bacterium]|nr:alpha/beta fold hydrolase [bacterium]